MTVTSLAWLEAIELTNTHPSDAEFFGKNGFREPRLPIHLIARFHYEYRPSPLIQNRMGEMKEVDPTLRKLVDNLITHLLELCKTGQIPHATKPHQDHPSERRLQYYLIAATDYADWLLTNKHEPSTHIAAWFHETGVNFAAKKAALQRLATLDEQVDPVDLPEHLYIANLAHRAVVAKGYAPDKGTIKQRLRHYIKTNYPLLTNGSRERIATIANPDKSTGPKKKSKD